MRLVSLELHHFRNYTNSTFFISPQITVVIGPNSQGKTNLLEAIHCILNGYGFRESKEEELLTIGASEAFIRADATNGSNVHYQIYYRKLSAGVEKIFSVNNSKQRYATYIKDSTRSILFSPDQINLIIGPPDGRRKYIDRLLSFYDYEYKKRLNNYEQGLRKRNKVLEGYRSREALVEELQFWNSYLEGQAAYITAAREAYISFLNEKPDIHSRIFKIEYRMNMFTADRAQSAFEQEQVIRRTTIGPQKDDFQISKKEGEDCVNIHLYGSRSEQRLALFWLHLREIEYCQNKTGKKPILLLDDIFSELDKDNRKLILSLISDFQTILTTTEEDILAYTPQPFSIISL